jgi:hypothetical protein
MISPTNPTEVTDSGTWKWMNMPGGTGMAQFFPNPASAPAPVTTSVTGTGVAGSGTANNTINLNNQTSSYSGFMAQPVKFPPPPAPPDYANLQALQDRVQRQKMIKQAMSQYDDLEASTRAMGGQAANNAGNVYSNRLMQQGVNPIASGVVAAQAKLPVYNQLAQINTEKQATRLDAVNKADSLAANIASTMANIQLGYSKMLADYNAQGAGYQLDYSKFNAAQAQRAQEFSQTQALDKAKLAAQIAASGGAGGTSSGRTGVPANGSGYRGTWRDAYAGTMALAQENPFQQLNRANLSGYLSRNGMWDDALPNYAVL